MKSKFTRLAGLALVLSLPGSAFAHTGVHHDGLLGGLMHPFGGIDHVLAMVLVGVWAAALARGRRVLIVPLAFVVFMAMGAALGAAGYGLPMLEAGIALSVVCLGLMLMTRLSVSLGIAAPLVGAFALFHGNAHGLEMQQAQFALYFVGFIAATVALHLAGMALGRKALAHEWVLLGLGLVSGIVGASLMLAA